MYTLWNSAGSTIYFKHERKIKTPLGIIIVMMSLIFSPALSFGEPLAHLTLEEIVITDYALSESLLTTVGIKTIEYGKNINLPDELEDELKKRDLSVIGSIPVDSEIALSCLRGSPLSERFAEEALEKVLDFLFP